jgi:carboxyl-terminal processing protease
MSSNLIRSLGLVSAVAIIPAATAGFAAVDVGTYRELEQFMSVFERVRSEYVEKVDDKVLLRGAIDGMLNALDPHSSYLDEKGFKSLMTTTEGEYGGLGLNVTMEDGAVKVIAPIEDSPGFKAGLKAGDYITHIDSKLIYGGTLDEAVDQMRGAPGTSLKITIVRPGRDKPFDVTLTRAIIELPAVKWEVKDRVGIINVNTFSRTTTDETLAAIAAIDKSLGAPPLGYIVDLRSNPGGLLDQASASPTCSSSAARSFPSAAARKPTSSVIMPAPAMPRRACRSSCWSIPAPPRPPRSSPGRSRSITARSSWASGTFGKGSVQTLLPLSSQTALRLTTARYFTPSGKSCRKAASRPTSPVPQLSDPDYKDKPKFRESDLRRHLINEAKVDDALVQDDGKPDPRFAMTAEQLKKQNITDYQLHYALQTISRWARSSRRAAGGAPKTGSR